jgi:hypothetical protein
MVGLIAHAMPTFGVVAYFLFFYKDDAFDEMEEKYDYHEDNKK